MITSELLDDDESTSIFFRGRIKPIESKKNPERTKNVPNQRSIFHQRLENLGRLDEIKYLNLKNKKK